MGRADVRGVTSQSATSSAALTQSSLTPSWIHAQNLAFSFLSEKRLPEAESSFADALRLRTASAKDPESPELYVLSRTPSRKHYALFVLNPSQPQT